MTTKADFSAAEWETLRDAPNLVVLAVATAGASGIFGSIAEAFAPSGVFYDVLKGNNDLLKAICQPSFWANAKTQSHAHQDRRGSQFRQQACDTKSREVACAYWCA